MALKTDHGNFVILHQGDWGAPTIFRVPEGYNKWASPCDFERYQAEAEVHPLYTSGILSLVAVVTSLAVKGGYEVV